MSIQWNDNDNDNDINDITVMIIIDNVYVIND